MPNTAKYKKYYWELEVIGDRPTNEVYIVIATTVIAATRIALKEWRFKSPYRVIRVERKEKAV